MSAVITEKIELETDICCVCGVLHAIPKSMRDRFYERGGRWYCPNGHHIGWDEKNSKTANDKLRAEIAQLNSRLEIEKNRVQAAQRSVAAAKGEVTKIKKRVENGVCPCCHRSFSNLQRHMTSKHPDFAKEAA